MHCTVLADNTGMCQWQGFCNEFVVLLCVCVRDQAADEELRQEAVETYLELLDKPALSNILQQVRMVDISPHILV